MTSSVHHIEIWVPEYTSAHPRWNWLLVCLGWSDFQDWPGGHSWRAPDGSYVVIEQSVDMLAGPQDRMRPGLNHLALTIGSVDAADALVAEAGDHGWSLLFPETHPFAGGPDHYAAYLEDEDGFEVEIVVVAEATR